MADTFNKGDKFGGFVTVARISMGEFGETWLCENPVTKRKAVLKGLKKDIYETAGRLVAGFDIVARTKEEAQIVAALGDKRFPFVPVLYDAVEIPDGRVFFLTEFVEGLILRDWIEKKDVTNEQRATVSVNLLQAANRLHAVGIVHRDLAGDNIIISEGTKVKIVDFGLAKIKSELLITKYSAKTVDPFTKAKYTPPKVFRARAEGRVVEANESWDLYAIGVLLFEIFSAKSVSTPEAEITSQALAELPCSEALGQLLDNGKTDNAPAGPQIAITLNRDLRKAGLEKGIPSAEVDTTIIETLREEIAQLQNDLHAKQGKTALTDITNFLSRLGLVYTVLPKEKMVKVDYTTDKAGKMTFIINASDDEILRISCLGLRYMKSKHRDLLESLNQANWNLAMIKAVHDPKDGEVRLLLHIPHKHVAIPYEEFTAQFVSMVQAAAVLAEQLDGKFPMMSTKAKSSKKKSQD